MFIGGRVQGVCFRMDARHHASKLGVTGWVRNLEDGRVEALAEGDEAAVDAFVEWCRTGPTIAQVTQFEVEYSRATGEFDSFTVRHHWQ